MKINENPAKMRKFHTVSTTAQRLKTTQRSAIPFYPQGGPMAQRARPAEEREGDAAAGNIPDLLWDMEAAWP